MEHFLANQLTTNIIFFVFSDNVNNLQTFSIEAWIIHFFVPYTHTIIQSVLSLLYSTNFHSHKHPFPNTPTKNSVNSPTPVNKNHAAKNHLASFRLIAALISSRWHASLSASGISECLRRENRNLGSPSIRGGNFAASRRRKRLHLF